MCLVKKLLSLVLKYFSSKEIALLSTRIISLVNKIALRSTRIIGLAKKLLCEENVYLKNKRMRTKNIMYKYAIKE